MFLVKFQTFVIPSTKNFPPTVFELETCRTGGGPDGNAPGEGRILYVHHVELAALGDEGRDGEGHHAAGRYGQEGVNDRPPLLVALESRTVERRPEQPEEYRT